MVYEYQKLAAEDIRFDVPLADACHEDRQKLCANVPPVSCLLPARQLCVTDMLHLERCHCSWL